MTKAYEVLTDERKREMWERWGNVEGERGGVKVGLALPQDWKEGGVSGLFIVMFVLIGITCNYFSIDLIIKWYNRMVLVDDAGVLYTTKRMLNKRMGNENDYEDFVEMLSNSHEFLPFKKITPQQDFINKEVTVFKTAR